MAYSADRTALVKMEASPSMVWSNLAAASHRIAFAHKDAVYHLSTKAADRKEPPALEKLPIPEPLGAITQIAFANFGGGDHLVVVSRVGLLVYAEDLKTVMLRKSLLELDVPEADVSAHYLAGIGCSADDSNIYIGTSWGELLQISPAKAGSAELVGRLKGHRWPVNAVAVDERVLASGDDNGTILQWNRATGAPLKVHEGAGLPCTSLLVRGDVIIAGFVSGHIRIYRAGVSAAVSFLEVELAAHARCVTALDWHPSQYTFASVGEDCTLNVWSLPEMAVSGGAKVLLDMSAKVKDTLLAGVQFARHVSRGHTPDLYVAPYDSHSLRIFLGL